MSNINAKMLSSILLPEASFPVQKVISQFLQILRRKLDGEKLILPELPTPLEKVHNIVARIEALAERIAAAQSLRRETWEETDKIIHSALNTIFDNKFATEFPNKHLGEIADIGSGVTLGRVLTGNTVRLPYLRVANVQDGYLDLRTVKEIDVLETEKDKWILQPGDILLTEGGDWDKLGRGTVWHDEIPACIHQNHIFRVRINQKGFLPEYLSVLIGSPYGKQYFRSASKQTTNLATINKRELRAFNVICPPIEEQQSIIDYINRLKGKVSSLRVVQDETARELHALLPSLLDRAFKGEL
jgi:type I restriction enzyme, S subunit